MSTLFVCNLDLFESLRDQWFTSWRSNHDVHDVLVSDHIEAGNVSHIEICDGANVQFRECNEGHSLPCQLYPGESGMELSFTCAVARCGIA